MAEPRESRFMGCQGQPPEGSCASRHECLDGRHPEKVAKELRNVLSSPTGMKSANVQRNLVVLDVQMRLQAAEDEIRQGKPALVRLQAATRQKEALLMSTEAAKKAVQKTRALLED